MKLPTGSTGRLAAMALLLAPVLALVQFVLVPVLEAYSAQDQQIEIARGQLERFQRLATQLPTMRAEVARLRDTDVLAPFLVNAANDALAAVELQERLKATAVAHEGRVLSTRVLKGTADGPFERVVVDARLEITLEGLQDLLHEIETRKPYLFVEELSVMDRPQRRGGATGVAKSLETRLTIYGLRRGAEPAGGARG